VRKPARVGNGPRAYVRISSHGASNLLGTRRSIPDYSTLEKCYASLCVNTGDLDPSIVTEQIGVTPSVLSRAGERENFNLGHENPFNIWCLLSKGAVESSDLCDHLDWLFSRIESWGPELERLRERGCQIGVVCHWLSLDGQAGPILSVRQIEKLAEHKLEVLLDVFCLGAEGCLEDGAEPS
jgi:Domain of unknown function (DUF4279)